MAIDLPATLDDINSLIRDQVQENIHLDYKDSRALDPSKRDEIAKDVSAFANSDGGLLVYGVSEGNNLPIAIDSGVDHTKFTRERLEQIISSNITPRIDDIRISAIPISAYKSVYAVKVTRSLRGPHQSSDKKYYKRFNFQSVPMDDYEINDVRNRRRTTPPLVSVDINTKQSAIIYLSVTNIGQQTAEDVTFEYSEAIQQWIEKEGPSLFTRGIKYLPPGRSYSFMYNTFLVVLHESHRESSRFEITASYFHPEIGQRISDVFYFDLMDYWNSAVLESEAYEQGKKLRESVDKLTMAVEKLNNKARSG